MTVLIAANLNVSGLLATVAVENLGLHN